MFHQLYIIILKNYLNANSEFISEQSTFLAEAGARTDRVI
jgi:hypothetical protein